MKAVLRRAARAWASWPLPRGPAVAVIGYHQVNDGGGSLAVSPGTFATHLDVLCRERPCRPVLDLDDALSRLAAGTAPRRAVVVTFDDAWADNYANAFGPLLEREIPVTLFAPSRLLGTSDHMTRAQLLDAAAAGIVVGAHSRTHAALPACSDAELEFEVRGSREDLEDLLGRPVTRFAYPVGLLDHRVRTAVAAAGFSSAVTTDRSWAQADLDPLRIPRNIMEDLDAPTFAAALRGGLNYLRGADAVRALLRR